MIGLEVIALAGVATVQDSGRPGWMSQGIAPGGALVPERLARANAAVHNPPGLAAVELVGTITVAARGRVLVACDRTEALVLEDGERWSVACRAARVVYLAIRGGLDVPVVLGGRGTLLVAGVGGLEGRALRRGDLLRAGAAEESAGQTPPDPDGPEPIRIIPGPDLDRLPPLALETLLASTFRVDPRSDRVGVRLAGGTLPSPEGPTGRSTPMVRGAVQCPPDAAPIVLGPDHPTTGGYPVVATVVRADLGRIAARPVGSAVRFATHPSLLQFPGQ